MPDITLTIRRGLRLHFCLDVGYHGRYVDGRLNNAHDWQNIPDF